MAVECYLTIDKYAAKADVGVSTVYAWMRSGVLQEGVHYVRLGGALRFPYPHCLEVPLVEPPSERPAVRPAHSSMPVPAPTQGTRRRPTRGGTMDLDYGL